MGIVTGREAVLAVYNKAAASRWVLPCFCTENLTTTEAVLHACCRSIAYLDDFLDAITWRNMQSSLETEVKNSINRNNNHWALSFFSFTAVVRDGIELSFFSLLFTSLPIGLKH